MHNYYDFLRQEIKNSIPSKFKTQGELAAIVGTTQANISMFLAGKRGMSFDIACKVLNALDISFQKKESSKDLFSLLPVGTENTDLKPINVHTLISNWDLENSEPIKNILIPQNYFTQTDYALLIDGDSMYPTIKNSSIVGINKNVNFVPDEVYAIRLKKQGKVMIKRISLNQTNTNYIIRSDNPDKEKYPQKEICIEENPHFLIGHVVWVWQYI